MEIKEIGRVQNDCEFPLDHFRKCEKESHIVIIDDFVEGLYGIDEWNHLQVIFGSPSSGEYWHKCLTDCGDSRSFLPRERPGGDGLPLGSAGKGLGASCLRRHGKPYGRGRNQRLLRRWGAGRIRCTLGNNALVYSDLGRLAVTFAVRRKNEGMRVRVRPDFRYQIDRMVPEFYPLMETVVKNRAGSHEDEAAFKAKGREAAFAILERPFEDFLIREEARPDLPAYAPITESAICQVCEEDVMATKTVSKGLGQGLCLVCAERPVYKVEGQGIVTRVTCNKTQNGEDTLEGKI